MRTKKYIAPIGFFWSLAIMASCNAPESQYIGATESNSQEASGLPGPDDIMYVGDAGNHNVQSFNARTGEALGEFVPASDHGLCTPTGLIFTNPPSLLVVDAQTVGCPNTGPDMPNLADVDLFDWKTGAFDQVLVSSEATNPHYVFNPRGVIQSGNQLIVADLGDVGIPGKLSAFDKHLGNWLYDFGTMNYRLNGSSEFHARGVVVGPDHLLYVSTRAVPDGGPGAVARFDLNTHKFLDFFVSTDTLLPTCGFSFHRPEGLVFGPDGNLYVTSFRTDASDTDGIDVFDGRTGACLKKIATDQVGQPRSYAQDILFGPGGYLFAPIFGGDADIGAVRRYNVATGEYGPVPFVPSGGPLSNPWYLTFRKTNPTTLNYPGGT